MDSATLQRHEGTDYLSPTERSEFLRQRFDAKYNVAKVRYKGPVALWRAFGALHARSMILQFILASIDMGSRLLTAYLLKEFIGWRKGKGHFIDKGWGFGVALLIIVSSVIQSFTFQHAWQFGLDCMLGIRVQLITALHCKVLRVTRATMHRVGIGDIIDVVSNDVRRLEEALPMWPYLILGPLGLLLVAILIAVEVGIVPMLVGIAVLLLSIPTQALFISHHIHVRTDLSKSSAQRVKLINEAVGGATSIKVNGLEKPFYDRVLEVRRLENHLLTERSLVRALSFTVMTCATPVAAAVIFIFAFYHGYTLNLAGVFYVVTLLFIPRDSFALYFVRAIEALAELHVAVSRVDRFLRSVEARPPGTDKPSSKDRDAIVCIKGTFAWDLKGSSASAVQQALSRALTRERRRLASVRASEKPEDSRDQSREQSSTPPPDPLGSSAQPLAPKALPVPSPLSVASAVGKALSRNDSKIHPIDENGTTLPSDGHGQDVQGVPSSSYMTGNGTLHANGSSNGREVPPSNGGLGLMAADKGTGSSNGRRTGPPGVAKLHPLTCAPSAKERPGPPMLSIPEPSVSKFAAPKSVHRLRFALAGLDSDDEGEGEGFPSARSLALKSSRSVQQYSRSSTTRTARVGFAASSLHDRREPLPSTRSHQTTATTSALFTPKQPFKRMMSRKPAWMLKSFNWHDDSHSHHGQGHEKPLTLSSFIPPALHNVDLTFKRGELVGIVGGRGSGKSSLLSALLQELPASKRHPQSYTKLAGSVAFVSQSMWLRNGSLRDNVLFGQPWNEARFHTVLKACCLDDDLSRLPQREGTDVGDHGRALSTGQKAQLCVARAAYSDPDVALLDNVFLSMDSDTVTTLFEECILRLMSRSTRIVAVTDPTLFKYFDRLVVLRDGEVVAQGTHAELVGQGVPEVLDPSAGDSDSDADMDVSDEEDFEQGDESSRAPKKASSLVGLLGRKTDSSRTLDAMAEEGGDTSRSPVSTPTESRRVSGAGDKIVFKLGTGAMTTSDSKRNLLALISRPSPVDVSRRQSNGLRQSNPGGSESGSEGPTPREPPAAASSGRGGIGLAGLLNADSAKNLATSRWVKLTKVTAARNVLAVAVRHEKRKREKRLKPDADQEELEQALARATDATSLDGQGDEWHTVNVWKAVYLYLRHMGTGHFYLAILLTLLGQSAEMVQHVWLARWAKTYGKKQEQPYYPITLGALSAFLVVITIARCFHFFVKTDHASTRICELFVWKLLRSPLSFFHATPSAQILNRASRDQSTVDDLYPMIVFDLVSMGLVILGSLIYASWALWYTAIAVLPLLGLFVVMRHYYKFLARESHRLESTTISPIINTFANTISGITFIRAYGFENHVLKQMDRQLDLNSGWVKVSRASARWLGLWVDLLSTILLGFFTLLTAAQTDVSKYTKAAEAEAATAGLVLADKGGSKYSATKDAALTALALSQIVALTDALRQLVKLLTELELTSVSAQRILDYTLLPEPLKRVEDDAKHLTPPKNWPRTGLVRFRDVVARYRPGLPPALKRVTFTVAPGMSTAFCGATGSGKSSVLLALMRAIDVTGGEIFFDGLDITKIGIDALQERIAVIPQDPIIFSSSIRYNLDPWGKATDAQIWRVAESLNLREFIQEAGGLDAHMDSEALALSLGERQCICLGRALLRKSHVLCLDEAVSGVDPETDQIMKKALRESATELDDQFDEAHRSVIIIAHHVSSLEMCDTLVVLDAGRVVEQGTPEALRSTPNGHFARMVAAHTKRRDGTADRTSLQGGAH